MRLVSPCPPLDPFHLSYPVAYRGEESIMIYKKVNMIGIMSSAEISKLRRLNSVGSLTPQGSTAMRMIMCRQPLTFTDRGLSRMKSPSTPTIRQLKSIAHLTEHFSHRRLFLCGMKSCAASSSISTGSLIFFLDLPSPPASVDVLIFNIYKACGMKVNLLVDYSGPVDGPRRTSSDGYLVGICAKNLVRRRLHPGAGGNRHSGDL